VIASTPRILIVEDDADGGLALSSELALAGYRCEVALSGPAALTEVGHTSFDAIISDLHMDGMSGLDLLETLTRDCPNLPVIIVTGFSADSASDAMDKGAFHFFTKPLDVEQLRGVIEQAIGDRRHVARVTDGFDEDVLLPTGAATRAMLTRIEHFADAQSPVLIRGESGTGKELVARALHARSARCRGPFVTINTAAIPEHLLESELFGHVRGAFSGATHVRRGLLTEAHLGTVLLDEIGDMPLVLQAKLLRVVQFGEVRPVGSDHVHFVDVRFLAATHRDLKRLAEAGQFRADLYYRLSVLELEVPALRDRRSEIPALVSHFLSRARERNRKSPVRTIASDASRLLAEAAWPGNIRELASMVERLVVLGQHAVVGPEDLVSAGLVTGSEATDSPALLAREGMWTLDQLTHSYVDWVLTQVQQDKQQAARILGINVSTLYRWLRDWPGAQSCPVAADIPS
jgi:two-component system, NtrC family, response regulator HydG